MDASNPNYFLEPLARVLLGLDYPEHCHEWGWLSETTKRLLVLASRDHSKSTFFDFILPINRLLRNKAYEILLVSYSDAQVMKLGSRIKEAFDAKPTLKQFSPRSEEDWSKSRLKFKDGSVVDTLTFGSSGRGGHYDLVLIDDPVKDFGGMNPDDQSQYLTRSLTPMCKPDGQIIVTGNYVYDDDLIDRIERNKAYTTKKYPCWTVQPSGERKALWPSYWPIAKLDERRAEIESSDDPFGFSKEYLLEKIDPKAQFFKRNMIQRYDSLPERMFRLLSVDPALSLDGDDTGIVVTGTGEDKKTRLLDHAKLKTDDVQAIVDEIFRLVMFYGIPYIQIETIGFQKMFKHHLYDAMRDKNHHFGIEEIKSHKTSKEARIMALQPRIAAGSFLFAKEGQEDVINQLCAFPRGAHDDLIDALSFQVGKWDAPGPIVAVAPKNSFDWWKTQVHNQPSDWQKALNV